MTPIDRRDDGDEEDPKENPEQPADEVDEEHQQAGQGSQQETPAVTEDEEPEDEEPEQKDGATARLRPDHKALEDRRFGPPLDEEGWDGPLETEALPSDDGLPRDGVVLTEASQPPASTTEETNTGPHPAPPRTTGRHKSPYGHARKQAKGSSGSSNNKWIALAVLVLVVVGGIFAYRSVAQAPKNVRLSVYVIPQWAELQLNGQEVKVNPLVMPRSRESVTLKATAVGYRNKIVIVTPDKDQTIRIPLTPSAGPGVSPTPAPKH